MGPPMWYTRRRDQRGTARQHPKTRKSQMRKTRKTGQRNAECGENVPPRRLRSPFARPFRERMQGERGGGLRVKGNMKRRGKEITEETRCDASSAHSAKALARRRPCRFRAHAAPGSGFLFPRRTAGLPVQCVYECSATLLPLWTSFRCARPRSFRGSGRDCSEWSVRATAHRATRTGPAF